MAYHRSHQVDTKIVRVFNTYGPRMRIKDGRALPNFMCQAIRGEDLTIYGDGLQTRSFCYVSDLVEGIYRLLISDEHEPVNIGNPEEITVLQLAKEILALTGSKSKIGYCPLPVDDPKVRQPDITKAKRSWGGNLKYPAKMACLIPYDILKKFYQKAAHEKSDWHCRQPPAKWEFRKSA